MCNGFQGVLNILRKGASGRATQSYIACSNNWEAWLTWRCTISLPHILHFLSAASRDEVKEIYDLHLFLNI